MTGDYRSSEESTEASDEDVVYSFAFFATFNHFFNFLEALKLAGFFVFDKCHSYTSFG